MDYRLAFLLLLLATICISSTARDIGMHELSESHSEIITTEFTGGNDQMCKLCKEYASQAIEFLSKNETRSEILSTLYQACSELVPLQKPCISLVDQYVLPFFVELSKIKPKKFCKRVKLCSRATILDVVKNDQACTVCQDVVEEILVKLKDPDTQLEVIEVLLKSCNKMENYVQQCKKLVFQYGPLIMVDAEKIFEKSDVCTTIHACKASQAVSMTVASA